jgi:hypothetical protein
MGMQSTAVRRFGQMSSTYLTSTLTEVIAALAVRKRPEDLERSLSNWPENFTPLRRRTAIQGLTRKQHPSRARGSAGVAGSLARR